MLGPYIKFRGTRGTEMSANADLVTVETYVHQGETIWKPVFHIWAKMYNWDYLGVLWGCLMIRLGLFCFPAILASIYIYISTKEANW